MLCDSDYRMHGRVLPQAGELFFYGSRCYLRRWLCSAGSLLRPRPYFTARVASASQGRRIGRGGVGACLREGTLLAPGGLPAGASPVTVLLKTCRSPNRQRQAAVFERAAAVAAARCCLCHTARASGAGSAATTRTRGWISHRPGPPTRLSCRDSGIKESPLRLRTWKTSWRWMAWPWRSVYPIRQAWSTGKRRAELDRDSDTPGTWTVVGLRTSRWEQLYGQGGQILERLLNRCFCWVLYLCCWFYLDKCRRQKHINVSRC